MIVSDIGWFLETERLTLRRLTQDDADLKLGLIFNRGIIMPGEDSEIGLYKMQLNE